MIRVAWHLLPRQVRLGLKPPRRRPWLPRRVAGPWAAPGQDIADVSHWPSRGPLCSGSPQQRSAGRPPTCTTKRSGTSSATAVAAVELALVVEGPGAEAQAPLAV